VGAPSPAPGWRSGCRRARRSARSASVDRVDAVGIERDVVLDRGDRRVRLLVGPDSIDRALATKRNAVIGAVAFLGAVGDVVSPLEQRHVDVLARDILHGWVTRLTERQRLPCIGDNPSCDLDDDTMRIALDRDGMIRPRYLDGLCLRFGMILHRSGPSTRCLAQRGAVSCSPFGRGLS
jgi:hypothetical protein